VGEQCSPLIDFDADEAVRLIECVRKVVASVLCVVANSHSNKEERSDASFAFAEKPTLHPTFCWSGYCENATPSG
jgi:hypothetical protein